MKVKEMHQMVLDLVGLDFMPEDSGIVYDNEKEVKKILAGIDMDKTMLLIAKQLGFDCVAQHHPAGIMNPNISELFGRDHMKKLMECGVPANHAHKLAYAGKVKRNQRMHSQNRTQMYDVAKLLDISDVAYHTPADILAERYVQKKMDALMEAKPMCTVQDIIDELLNQGMSKRTIYTAKKELCISSYKVRDNWYWHLPEDVAMLFSDDTRKRT